MTKPLGTAAASCGCARIPLPEPDTLGLCLLGSVHSTALAFLVLYVVGAVCEHVVYLNLMRKAQAVRHYMRGCRLLMQ